MVNLPLSLQEAIRRLEAFPDVTRVSGSAGQILIYPGHTAPGVFIVVGGVVHVEPRPGERMQRTIRKDAALGPFILPGLEDLTRVAERLVRFEQPTEMLFVPRYLVVADPEVQELLRDAHFPTLSLH